MAQQFLLRARDTTLLRTVYWYSAFPDASEYSGPGPLLDIVLVQRRPGVLMKHQPASPNGPAPDMQFQGMTVNPAGTKVFVGGASSIDPIWSFFTSTNLWDAASPAPIASLQAYSLVFNLSGTKLYALRQNGTQIDIINPTTMLVTGTVSGLPSDVYSSMTLNPAGNELWVTGVNALGNIRRVNTTTDAYISSFAVGVANPSKLVFNPSGTKAYLLVSPSLSLSVRVIVFDTSTLTPIVSFSDTPVFRSIVALPNGSEVWAGSDTNGLIRISTTTNAIVGSPIALSVPTGAYDLVAKPDSSKVYALLVSGNIDIVNVGTHLYTSTIATSSSLGGRLLINSTGTLLYASNPQSSPASHSVKVISLTTNLVTATINGGSVTPTNPTTIGDYNAMRVHGTRMTDDGGQVRIELPVVFDDVPETFFNIKANRPFPQESLNDQSKSGITNFGVGSTAGGNNATVGGGVSNQATDDASTVPGGDGNSAGGYAAFASGGGSSAGGDYSTAMGASNASRAYAVALGNGALAEGDDSVATSNFEAEGDRTVAMGGSATASGDDSAAIGGFGAVTEGDGAFAANEALAQGTSSAALNEGYAAGNHSFSVNSSKAAGQDATALNTAFADGQEACGTGGYANAKRYGQRSHASGKFSTEGDAQESLLVFRGTTPGSGAGESVELLFGSSQQFALEDNRGYLITVSVVAKGAVSASPNVQTFKQTFAVRRTAGTTTIAQAGALEQLGDAASVSWTLAASVLAGPDRFALTFTTGSTTSAAKVVAKVEFVEVLN